VEVLQTEPQLKWERKDPKTNLNLRIVWLHLNNNKPIRGREALEGKCHQEMVLRLEEKVQWSPPQRVVLWAAETRNTTYKLKYIRPLTKWCSSINRPPKNRRLAV
jgi:hypothetical protein